MRFAVVGLATLLPLAIALGGCPRAAGEYAQSDRMGGADRGETNGRTFDFVSHRSEGDDWTIRLRDDSMWVNYASGEEEATDLGTSQLSSKESSRIWGLIDTVDIASRKKGKPNEEDGYYEIAIREPAEEGEPHDRRLIYVSRDTDDEDVQALAEYLVKLIVKHHPKYKKDEDDIL